MGVVAVILTTAGISIAKHKSHHWRHHHGHKAGLMILKHADTDKNGEISKQEFNDAHDKKFKEYDKNADGIVTAKEVQAKLAERYERMAKRITRRFDQDRDGKVTAAEFKAHAEQKMYRLDLNDDEVISKDELPRHRGYKRWHHKRGHYKDQNYDRRGSGHDQKPE